MVESLANKSSFCRLTFTRKQFSSAHDALQALKVWTDEGAQGWAQWTSAVRKVKSTADLSATHTPDFNRAQKSILKGTLLEAELAVQNRSVRVFYQNQQWIWVESTSTHTSAQDADHRSLKHEYLSTLNQTPYETTDPNHVFKDEDPENAVYEIFWSLHPQELADLDQDACFQVGPSFSRFCGWKPYKLKDTLSQDADLQAQKG